MSIRVGKHKFYFPNGQIETEKMFVDDRPIGVQFAYYPDGNIRHKIYYDNLGALEKMRFYDRNGRELTEDIETDFYASDQQSTGIDSASYFRAQVWHDGELFVLRTFMDGTPKSIKTYSDREMNQKEGKHTWYHPNGQISTERIYSDDKEVGLHFGYYEGGELRFKSRYDDSGNFKGTKFYSINGELITDSVFVKYYSKEFKSTSKEEAYYYRERTWKNGLLISTAYYMDGTLKYRQAHSDSAAEIREGTHSWYRENGSLDEKWTYLNDLPVGDQYGFYPTGEKYYQMTYDDSGTLERESYFTKDGRMVNKRIVEREPEYPGGQEALFDFIARETSYPEEARQNGIQGTVYVEFSVSESGKTEDPKVTRSVHPWLDAEALRVTRLIPNFHPGLRYGEPAPYFYKLPFRFGLTSSE